MHMLRMVHIIMPVNDILRYIKLDNTREREREREERERKRERERA